MTLSTASPARALIANADDFGLTAGVNAGIIGAHRRGIVRSVSLMVTTPGFADAVRLARDERSLDLGVHLTLTGGLSPALPPADIPSLVGPDGRFPALGVWLARVARGTLDQDEARRELGAQLLRARRTGLNFSHLDGHHHAHLFGPVAAVVRDLAADYGIAIVRRPGDPGGRLAAQESGDAKLKRRLLTLADHRWGGRFGRLERTTAFAGLRFPWSLANWRALLAALPAGVTELMCHPGLVDPDLCRLDRYRHERVRELRWLCDARVTALLDREGISVVSFAQAREHGLLRAATPE